MRGGARRMLAAGRSGCSRRGAADARGEARRMLATGHGGAQRQLATGRGGSSRRTRRMLAADAADAADARGGARRCCFIQPRNQNVSRIWFHCTPPWADSDAPSLTKPNLA